MSCYHFYQYYSQLLLLFEFTNPPQEWALALIMYRIKGAGRKVLAGDAVLWSGSDGGRCSVVGDLSRGFLMLMGYANATILYGFPT